MTEELKAKIIETGVENERAFGGCAQCVLLTLSQTVLPIDPVVIKSATALMAGGIRSGYNCGAFSGGLMAISFLTGRTPDDMTNLKAVSETAVMGRELLQKFMDEYGSPLCRDIQYKIMGKSYRMYDPEDAKRFNEDGGHVDKCTMVVGKAALWTREILEKYGYIK